MHKAHSQQQLGFTIVELLVVIVVIGILAAITIVSYTGISKQAIASSLQSDLARASKQLKLFQVDNGSFPTSVTTCPATAGTMCLKPSSNNEFLGYERPTAQTFILDAKNGSTVFRITDESKPGEVAPITAIAAISGTVRSGSVLTTGVLTPSAATATYKWQVATTSNGTFLDIPGATSGTYTPTSSDVGKYLRVIATGTGTYWDSVQSTVSGPVAQVPPIFASGGTITTSGGYRTHTFGSGTYSLTTNHGGTAEVVISGAGGGGGSLDSSNARSATGGNSSIQVNGQTYIAYGGTGGMSTTGFTCLGAGGDGAGGATATAGLGTLTGITGGGSAGGFAGYQWDGDSGCTAGTGGAGGRISGTITVTQGIGFTVVVGNGGNALPSSDYDGGSGSAGSITVRYPG